MILGLTGGIASGKSTVSKRFAELGCHVVDADKISKEISNSESVLKRLEESFGLDIVLDGELDRYKLKDIVFNDKKKREVLNNIMHPVILERINQEIFNNKKEELIVLDIPLLYEVGLEYLCDKVLLVYTDEATQIERIKKRDSISKELARKIIDSQMSVKLKIKKSDIHIENNENLILLLEKVDRIYNKIIKGVDYECIEKDN